MQLRQCIRKPCTDTGARLATRQRMQQQRLFSRCIFSFCYSVIMSSRLDYLPSGASLTHYCVSCFLRERRKHLTINKRERGTESIRSYTREKADYYHEVLEDLRTAGERERVVCRVDEESPDWRTRERVAGDRHTHTYTRHRLPVSL